MNILSRKWSSSSGMSSERKAKKCHRRGAEQWPKWVQGQGRWNQLSERNPCSMEPIPTLQERGRREEGEGEREREYKKWKHKRQKQMQWLPGKKMGKFTGQTSHWKREHSAHPAYWLTPALPRCTLGVAVPHTGIWSQNGRNQYHTDSDVSVEDYE